VGVKRKAAPDLIGGSLTASGRRKGRYGDVHRRGRCGEGGSHGGIKMTTLKFEDEITANQILDRLKQWGYSISESEEGDYIIGRKK
jgi:hypothetical protein